MQATITNYRGVAQATLDLTKIALVAGPNAAGKSSTAQAVAAALTGDGTPIPGIKKATAGTLVRSGTASGSITLGNDKGQTTVVWPAASVKTTGIPPQSSVYGAGLRSIVDLDDKTRVQVLTEYLAATPTLADLEKKLTELGFPEPTITKLWELIELQGWDGAHAQVKEKGAKLKGQWEMVTNDRYGTKKAETWIPEGYEPNLESSSETTLQSFVTDARDMLEAAIAASAVDASKREEWEGLSAKLGERQSALAGAKAVKVEKPAVLTDLEQQLADARRTVADAIKFRDSIKTELESGKSASKPYDRAHCPQCKTLLHIDSNSAGHVLRRVEDEQPTLTNADEIKSRLAQAEESLAEYTKIRDDLDIKCAEENGKYTSALAAQSRAVHEAERLAKESEEATRELKAVPQSAGPSASVEDCRKSLHVAETRLKAYQSKTNADWLHKAISQNQELLAVLAPDGIRGDVLTKSLAGFNTILAAHTTVANWRPVEITPEFTATYGGTPYYLCSESEKYRVRVALQIGMAAKDNSQVLVIDGADILDKGGRNGLFGLLRHVGKSALVCMTLDSLEIVPNLAKAGRGVSYWIGSDGVVREV